MNDQRTARFGVKLALALCLVCQSVAAQESSVPPQSNNSWDSQGVAANHSSPGIKLHSVPVRAVKLGSGFWSARMEANKKRSLPSLLSQLEEHGVVDNFRRLSGRKKIERKGPLYTDSDLYKWMEAAAFVLQSGDDPQIRSSLEKMIDEVVAAQGTDGYLNTYYVDERAKERFTNFRHGHELYCLGHLLQAGIAYYRAMGERRLLDAGIRFADYAISQLGPGKKPAFAGHPEIEMALVELYRTTKQPRYLEFADYLLNSKRPELKLNERDIAYTFSGVPFATRQRFEGHSVRAMYAAGGAADYFAETRDAELMNTLGRLWQDLVTQKMYITGSVGSREVGEAIGEPYELPNEQAYTETCAAIGNYMWNWRMLAITGEAKFASIGERALYNGVLSGVSLSGDHYFYRNPLSALGRTERKPWYTTTCCPPNIQRTLASLPGYFYSTSAAGLWTHLYHNSQLDWQLENGRKIRVSQQTDYPWKNVVEFTIAPESKERFSLFLRIPEWSDRTRVSVNGAGEQEISQPSSYFELNRIWQTGDKVRVTFDMPVKLIEANPRVRDNFGRVAVQRGPLVYCLEGVGNDQPSPFDISLLADENITDDFIPEFRTDVLGGVTVIRARAVAVKTPNSQEPLYRVLDQRGLPESKQVEVTLIPYYAWANRGPSEMEVWLPWTRQAKQK